MNTATRHHAPAVQDHGDLGIRIDRDGVWHYRGLPINRQEMVCLFASLLHRLDDDTYWLITPAEAGRITVDDVPFIAVELFTSGAGGALVVSMRTNVDEIVTVDTDHPLRMVMDLDTGTSTPYLLVRDGLEARVARSVYYELVALGVEEKVGHLVLFGIWSSGTFFPMGSLEAED
ncbi:MAG: DUF1285 domain-containing protein [Alphaproteobacteria bacterium]